MPGSPEAYNAPPPAGLLAALAPPPSKKRKSVCECWVGQLAGHCWASCRRGASLSLPNPFHAGWPVRTLLTLPPPHLPPPQPAAGVPVPADAPFELTYLNARLPVAQEDELQQVGCGQLGLEN